MFVDIKTMVKDEDVSTYRQRADRGDHREM